MDLSVEADPGVPVRAVLQWPPGETTLASHIQVWVLLRRPGGVLLVVPNAALGVDSLVQLSQEPEDGSEPLVGPHTFFGVNALTMTESGALQDTGEELTVFVVDMGVPAISGMVVPYPEDPTEQDLLIPFVEGDPSARPDMAALIPMVRSWVETEVFERTAYYSAQEEAPVPKATAKAKTVPPGSTTPGKATAGAKAVPKRPTVAALAQQVEALMSTLPNITQQLAKLASQQEEMSRRPPAEEPQMAFQPIRSSRAAQAVSSLMSPGKGQPLSGLAKMMGPPPPVRRTALPEFPVSPKQTVAEDEPLDWTQGHTVEENGSPMAQALLEQSKVLQAIMSHFHASGSDPISDLSSTTPTTGVKGTLARERLQRELSTGSGQFFLKVCQQIQRRMAPTSRPVSSLSETSEVSLLAYLERYGGYGQCRELGMIQWSLGHVFDAMAAGEMGLACDHLALTSVMVEQASLDANKWGLAWQQRLLDDPPQNLWISRGQTATGARRPFAPLSTQSWNTVALAFMKEAEILQGKRSELLDGKPQKPENPAAKPSPKRKPGKGGKGANAPQTEEAS